MSRRNGIAATVGEFQLEMSSRPPNSGPCRNSSTSASIAVGGPGQRAVDALLGEQHAALQIERRADRAQGLAQLPEVRQCGELIEGGDPVSHHGRVYQEAGNAINTSQVIRPLPRHRTRCRDEPEKHCRHPPTSIAQRRMECAM